MWQYSNGDSVVVFSRSFVMEPPLSLCSSFSPYLACAVSVCKYMLKITLRAIEPSAFYELLSGVVAE